MAGFSPFSSITGYLAAPDILCGLMPVSIRRSDAMAKREEAGLAIVIADMVVDEGPADHDHDRGEQQAEKH